MPPRNSLFREFRKGLALLLFIASPLAAAPGGDIDTMAIGQYFCERPGDATGPVGIHAQDEDFAIVNASSYRAHDQMGSYLLTGDTLAMTSGPHEGKRYHRLTSSFLRRIGEDGKDTSLRCIRRRRNNSAAGAAID